MVRESGHQPRPTFVRRIVRRFAPVELSPSSADRLDELERRIPPAVPEDVEVEDVAAHRDNLVDHAQAMRHHLLEREGAAPGPWRAALAMAPVLRTVEVPRARRGKHVMRLLQQVPDAGRDAAPRDRLEGVGQVVRLALLQARPSVDGRARNPPFLQRILALRVLHAWIAGVSAARIPPDQRRRACLQDEVEYLLLSRIELDVKSVGEIIAVDQRDLLERARRTGEKRQAPPCRFLVELSFFVLPPP